jgi:hypothetical protein
MPKQTRERKIIQLEKENLNLRKYILNLERKIDEMKADYETKLKVKSKIIISEEDRQKLIAQRDRARSQ